MFPIRHSWIFRSRWLALLWAAGMIWFALDVAGEPAKAHEDQNEASDAGTTDALGQPVDEQQARTLFERLER